MICKPCSQAGELIVTARETNPNFLGTSYVTSVDGDRESVDDKELFVAVAITLHSICKNQCPCAHLIDLAGNRRAQ